MGSAAFTTGSVAKWEWDIGSTGTFRRTASGDTTITLPSAPDSNFLCILRVTDDDGLIGLDSVRFTISPWKSLPNLPVSLWGISTITLNDRIYAAGGKSPSRLNPGLLDKSEFFGSLDPEGDRWKTGYPGAYNVGFVELHGKGYLFSQFSRVREFDPLTETWDDKNPFLKDVYNSSAVASVGLGDNIYVLNQWSVHKYNVVSNLASEEGPLDRWRAYMGVAAVNGKVYALGGYSIDNITSARIDELDPATDTWSVKGQMPFARGLAATTVLEGKIYVIGGQANLNGVDVVYRNVDRYDPATGTWESLYPLPFPISGGAATVVKGKIVVVGGRNGSQLFNSVLEFQP